MATSESTPIKRILVVVAAPAEARAVLAGLETNQDLATRTWELLAIHESIDLLISGVGKSNAAGATARFLDPNRHRAVLSVGVCGSLPGSDDTHPAPVEPRIGAVIAASASVFADEGVLSDNGFADISTLGFPPLPGAAAAIETDATLLAALRPLADAIGRIATVSTCSGTDAAAFEIARRTGGIAEAMEGAAIALVARRVGVGFAELRVVSNTTGSRTRQVWDLKAALARLSDLASRVPQTLALRSGRLGEG